MHAHTASHHKKNMYRAQIVLLLEEGRVMSDNTAWVVSTQLLLISSLPLSGGIAGHIFITIECWRCWSYLHYHRVLALLVYLHYHLVLALLLISSLSSSADIAGHSFIIIEFWHCWSYLHYHEVLALLVISSLSSSADIAGHIFIIIECLHC